MVYFWKYVILYLEKHVYQYISLYFTLISFMVVWFGPTQPNVISNHQITKTVHLDYYLLRIHRAYWSYFF